MMLQKNQCQSVDCCWPGCFSQEMEKSDVFSLSRERYTSELLKETWFYTSDARCALAFTWILEYGLETLKEDSRLNYWSLFFWGSYKRFVKYGCIRAMCNGWKQALMDEIEHGNQVLPQMLHSKAKVKSSSRVLLGLKMAIDKMCWHYPEVEEWIRAAEAMLTQLELQRWIIAKLPEGGEEADPLLYFTESSGQQHNSEPSSHVKQHQFSLFHPHPTQRREEVPQISRSIIVGGGYRCTTALQFSFIKRAFKRFLLVLFNIDHYIKELQGAQRTGGTWWWQTAFNGSPG